MHTYINTHVRKYSCMHALLTACVDTEAFVGACECVRVCVYECMSVYMCLESRELSVKRPINIWHADTCTYIHSHWFQYHNWCCACSFLPAYLLQLSQLMLNGKQLLLLLLLPLIRLCLSTSVQLLHCTLSFWRPFYQHLLCSFCFVYMSQHARACVCMYMCACMNANASAKHNPNHSRRAARLTVSCDGFNVTACLALPFRAQILPRNTSHRSVSPRQATIQHFACSIVNI